MTDHLDLIRSGFEGMVWPAVPPEPGALLLALQFQLNQTQWWTPEKLRQAQFRHLAGLLRHARETVPFYRERLDFDPGVAITQEWWAALPLLTRADVHAQGQALCSRNVPAAHAPLVRGHTSGSTGTPITYLTTAITRLFWQAFNLRDQLWHRRDLGLKFAAIRTEGARDERGMTVDGWGASISSAFRSGPSGLLHSSNFIDRQLQWLTGQDPDYLLMLPSNMVELGREMGRRGLRLARLREVRTYGEALSREARAECQALFGVKVVDMYTSQEAGYIALQCPDHDHYHLQSESVMVEILDGDGQPCAPGTIGKVVITTLHNYAMPLIRYDIGDYAEAGAPCSCGRGLPVIRRILGRNRNLLVAPDGRKFFPSTTVDKWIHIAPIRQLQLVQKTRQLIEVRIAAARALDAGEERDLAAGLRLSLGHPYEFELVYMERIPRAVSGKFEDFISEVGD